MATDRYDASLDIHGSHQHPTTTVTSATTAVAGRHYSVNTTSGSVTMTLPTLASTDDGAEFTFYKTAAANSMVIDGAGAETIEGSANVTRTAQYAYVKIRKASTVWQLVKSAQPDGDLVSTNNLSDVADASTAAQNIGALEAANDLSDLASATTARGNLGIALILVAQDLDLVGANTAQWRYVHPTGAASATLTAITSVLSGALTTGDATITADIEGTPVTDGAITITQVGSAEDDVDTVSPSAANVIAAGEVLTLTVGGANDATRTANVSIRMTY